MNRIRAIADSYYNKINPVVKSFIANRIVQPVTDIPARLQSLKEDLPMPSRNEIAPATSEERLEQLKRVAMNVLGIAGAFSPGPEDVVIGAYDAAKAKAVGKDPMKGFTGEEYTSLSEALPKQVPEAFKRFAGAAEVPAMMLLAGGLKAKGGTEALQRAAKEAEIKGLTPEVNPLIAEARKYKSVDEFIKEFESPSIGVLTPGLTIVSKPAAQKKGFYYHGTDAPSALKIGESGKIKSNISPLDELGEKTVSLSGDRGVANSYGNIIFEVSGVKAKPAPSGAITGNINGKELSGAEYRVYGDIPKENIKKAIIKLGAEENQNTPMFIGWERGKPLYKTVQEVANDLNNKGIKTLIVPHDSKLTDIYNQANKKK